MTAEQLEQLLDRQAFEQYLRSLDPAAPIGVAKDACDCPLARWLKACGAPDSVEVSEDTIVIQRHHNEDIAVGVDAPEWVRAFVMGIDGIPGNDVRVAEQGVRLMGVLDICISEMNEDPENWDDQTSDRQQ